MSRILNRLMKGRQRGQASAGQGAEDAVSRQDNALALSHLKKIYSLLRDRSSPGATTQSREDLLYSMIPLFNRVS